MSKDGVSRSARGSKLAFILFVCWIVVLTIAGGASRMDVLGQFFVRGAAWTILLTCILFLPNPPWRAYSSVAWFLLALVVLVALQLVPLPPSLWLGLPGRDLFAQLNPVIGDSTVWRPLSISPGWTFNALGSLVVAITTFVLVVALGPQRQQRVLTLLLGMAAVSGLVGLLEFSGASFDHPLVNDVPGGVSGFFANRNHFALMLALAAAIVPFWAFGSDEKNNLRMFAGAGLLVFFLPIILATGSRAGMLLSAIGVILGIAGVWRPLKHRLSQIPKFAKFAAIGGGVAVLGGVMLASITLGRAASVDRAIELGADDSVRLEAYKTTTKMIGHYFPVGTGFGTFDPAYRIAESADFLRPLYMNQAHNDLLQVILEGGLVALILLILALAWLGWSSWQAWFGNNLPIARLGSIFILLIVLASVVDYPARTPVIMSMATIAAVWLSMPHPKKASPTR